MKNVEPWDVESLHLEETARKDFDEGSSVDPEGYPSSPDSDKIPFAGDQTAPRNAEQQKIAQGANSRDTGTDHSVSTCGDLMSSGSTSNDSTESATADPWAEGDFFISSPSFLLPKMQDSDELGSWALEMEKEYVRMELVAKYTPLPPLLSMEE